MTKNNQNVWLSIKGVIEEMGHADQESKREDHIELSTEGQFYRENKTSCITYEETEVSGLNGTTTTVKVDRDRVSVIRMGSVNSVMEFEQGKRSVTNYATPYGDISMGFFTRGVDISYNEVQAPVKVKVNYDVEVCGQTNTRHTLDIEVSDFH